MLRAVGGTDGGVEALPAARKKKDGGEGGRFRLSYKDVSQRSQLGQACSDQPGQVAMLGLR